MQKIMFSVLLGISMAGESTACTPSGNLKDYYDYDYLSNEFIFQDDIKFTDDTALELRNAARSDLGHSVMMSDSIFLVKPRFEPVNFKTPYFRDLPLGVVKFEILNVIKGENGKPFYLTSKPTSATLVPNPEYFSGDVKKEYESFKSLSRARHEAHKGFEFWDTQLMADSKMAFPPQGNSCSVDMISNFVFGDSYLYIGNIAHPHRARIEPVSGINDPLVQKVIEQVQTKTWVKRSISPQKFFEKMDYGASVTLTRCPSSVRRTKTGWWDPFNGEPHKHKPFKKMRGFDANEQVLEWINNDWPGLFVHYPDSQKNGVSCKGKENYFVFGYGHPFAGKPQLTEHPESWPETKSNIRYAKIIDGEVLMSSVKTQYALEGPDRIPLKTVLSWVPAHKP